jgi:hypothetical protein
MSNSSKRHERDLRADDGTPKEPPRGTPQSWTDKVHLPDLRPPRRPPAPPREQVAIQPAAETEGGTRASAA